MSMQSDQTLVVSLKQMVQYCHSIQQSLELDQEYFRKNDMARISKSTEDKAQLIERMTNLTNDLKSDLKYMGPANKSGDILAALENYSARPDTREKREINTLVRELKSVIEKCHQYLLTNSKVVYTNMSNLKNTWDKLLACQSDSNCLYDHKGNTGK